jgi:2-C-methyl-D-erythritol 4-phosphate cytidylyltransferase
MKAAIIVAAGRGTRMGPNVDKLFMDVAGRPLVAHTWARWDRCVEIDSLVLVVRAGMEDAFHEMARASRFAKPFALIAGGQERQDSVWNGLEALGRQVDLVAIHDGARPCTSMETIRATLAAAAETGAAVAAQRVTDTIKQSDGGSLIERTVDRSRLWAVQTPQAFRVEVIRRALETVRRAGALVTDDTAACELIGQAVRLVESHAPNPKATSPADLPFIASLLGESAGAGE